MESLNVSNAAAIALYAASLGLVFRRDRHSESVQLGVEEELAGKRLVPIL